MSQSQWNSSRRDSRASRHWTGWTILLSLFGFFGVIFLVNGVMVYEALSTLTGVDTDSAYQAGRMFERDVAMSRAQDARHWRVDAQVTAITGGARKVDIVARDATGAALGGVVAMAKFERPTDRRQDQDITIAQADVGHFSGSADLPPGQWDLVIELSRDGDRLFRSVNRIILK